MIVATIVGAYLVIAASVWGVGYYVAVLKPLRESEEPLPTWILFIGSILWPLAIIAGYGVEMAEKVDKKEQRKDGTAKEPTA